MSKARKPRISVAIAATAGTGVPVLAPVESPEVVAAVEIAPTAAASEQPAPPVVDDQAPAVVDTPAPIPVSRLSPTLSAAQKIAAERLKARAQQAAEETRAMLATLKARGREPAPASRPVEIKPLEPDLRTLADRENPEKNEGERLRQLAHSRGISWSELAHKSDEQIRVQLQYLHTRSYDEA